MSRDATEQLRRRVTEGLARGEFEPYFQLVVDRGGTAVGAEMVSRWHSPEGGLLMPERYIDWMTRTGAITEHDLYLFRCACEQLQTWKRAGRERLHLSCNFTRRSLSDGGFFERVREITELYDFSRDRLVLEITENIPASDRSAAQRTVEGLSALGFRIALDDIGSGYSSLADLGAYPIDYVKIDRALVLGAAEERGRRLLFGIAELAHGMGVRVLCEGVETKEQLDTVLEAGCDLIQGYYFSRVLPRQDAARYLDGASLPTAEEAPFHFGG